MSIELDNVTIAGTNIDTQTIVNSCTNKDLNNLSASGEARLQSIGQFKVKKYY